MMKTIAKKTLSSFLFLALFGSFVFANTGNDPIDKVGKLIRISGKIIDQNTGEALTGVKILFSSTDKSVYTDFDGEFEFEFVYKEDAELKISLISYEEKIIKIGDFESFTLKLQRQK